MKINFKNTVIYISAFIITVAILLGFLYLSALIPNEAIKDNMLKSAEYYLNQETIVRANENYQNSTADNYADTVLHTISWNMGKGEPFRAILDTKYYDGTIKEGFQRVNVGFYDTVTRDKEPNVDYTRYVHGSAAFIRIFHLFTDTNGIKLIGFIAILASSVITCLFLIRKKHISVAVMLLISCFAVNFWYLYLSHEYQSPFLICFLLCPFYLWLERKGDNFLVLLSVIGGVAVAFFDFLTTETVAILIPLLLVYAVRDREGRFEGLKRALFTTVSCGISYLMAYASTFVLKWGLASLVTGENKFILAVSSATDRAIGTGVAGSDVENPFLQVIYALLSNLTAIFGGYERVEIGRSLSCLAIIALFIVAAFLILPRKKANKEALVLFLFIGAIVPLRFLVLNNHSYIHSFFTYRAFVSTCLAILLWLSSSLSLKDPKKEKISKKKRRKA